MKRIIRTALIGGLLAGASLGMTAGGVAAYGHADAPLAQIEFSANCDNPGFPLCAAPPNGFGLGGVWVWIEIDSNYTADVAGAGCSHNIDGPRGGAGSIRGEFGWWPSTGPNGFPAATDPNNLYYNVDWGDGPIAFPRTPGHYGATLAPGVSIQLTVAP